MLPPGLRTLGMRWCSQPAMCETGVGWGRGYTETMGGETSRVIECSGCHTIMAQGVGASVPEEACPTCGASAKLTKIDFQSTLSPTSRLAAHKPAQGADGIGEAVRVSGPRERSAAADVSSLTTASYQIDGPSPRGEEGRLETVQLLVQKLRELGEAWGDPEEVDIQDVDCRALGEQGTLELQVTRAPHTNLWKTLHQAGAAAEASSPDELADHLLEVARAKARLPAAQLGSLTFAIDACDTPVFAMAGVVNSFRHRLGGAAQKLGFASMWVVGPTVQLVARLDT
jgi:hypothetical protein